MTPIVDDWGNGRTTQYNPSPLSVRGDELARRANDMLELIDARSLKVIDRVTERYLSMCVLQNGTLLAFARPDAGPCEIDVFEGKTLAHTIPVSGCSTSDGWRLVLAGASTIYLSRTDNRLSRYELENGALAAETSIVLEDGSHNGLDQLVGLPDGRVLLPIGRTLHAYGGARRESFRASAPVAHLCVGASGQVWYSLANEDGKVFAIALAKLEPTLAPKTTLSLAPGRVTHMASGTDGSLAAMVLTVSATSAGWTLVLLDPQGGERRRIAMPDDIVDKVGADLNAAFVALTSTSVIVDAGRHGLFGWNLATGARIGT